MGDKGLLKGELERIEQMRDELRLQAHLFKADMRDEWKDIEKRVDTLRRDLKPVQHAAEKTMEDISDSSRLLIDSVFDGMKRLRDSLK